jgi:DNA-directed RNA polymerase subunit H (RpoH/RPB5)
MSKQQADLVQQHTGVDPEELAQAMDELGIEKQKVTDADQDAEQAQARPTRPTAARTGQAARS